MTEIIGDVYQGSDEDNYYDSINVLEEVEDTFHIDTYWERKDLEERFEEENYKQADYYEPHQNSFSSNSLTENKQIISMFQSYE